MNTKSKPRSFFATTAGILTGIAGVLTAVVALLGLAAQQGWIGSKGSAPTTAAPGPAGPAGTEAPADVSVTPGLVDFDRLGGREATVTVRNPGRAAVSLGRPTVTGASARNFAATPGEGCARLDPGRSCEVRVVFTPTGGGTYTAVLVISPAGAPAVEVPLRGSALL